MDVDQLASMVSCVVDGGMGKTLEDPQILPRQIMLFRSYIKLVFQPALAARVPLEALSA